MLVFSLHTNESSQIKPELEKAVREHIPILPLKVDSTLPSGSFEYFIMTIHWLDASSPPIDVHFEKLRRSVRWIIESKSAGGAVAALTALGPNLIRALQHCEIYESTYARVRGLDDDMSLPRAASTSVPRQRRARRPSTVCEVKGLL